MRLVNGLMTAGFVLTCLSEQVLAQAGSCNLSGKTLNSVVQACVYDYNGAGSVSCKAAKYKVGVIGRNVLVYWGADTGVEYTLGETRDLVSGAPEIQKNLLLSGEQIPDSYTKIMGSAFYDGAQLTISQIGNAYTTVPVPIYQQRRTYRPGEVVATELQRIVISIGPGCSSCRIADYTWKASVFGTMVVQVMLKASSCTLN